MGNLPPNPVTPSITRESAPTKETVLITTFADIATKEATPSIPAANISGPPPPPPPTKPNVRRLAHYLSSYPPHLKSYLINGFHYGFRLPSSLSSLPKSSYGNHPSVTNNPSHVSSKLAYELSLNRIAGPFPSPPFKNFITSPLGLIPKRNSPDFRLIHDLSFPHDNSVNSHIDKALTSVYYQTLDDCVSVILSLGRGALVAKADLKDAFRIIPIHPVDYRLLGFKWQNKYYYDKCLPMGCSLSCSIFESFSSSLEWILVNKLSVPHISHILDDFIFFGPASSPICSRSLDTFFLLCQSLSIPVKSEKTVRPATTVVLHGIEVDTVAMSLRLPQDKLQEARHKVLSLSKRKSVTLKELQSVLGTLSFACRAIVPGRAFLRRLFALTKGVSSPSFHIRLTREARRDLSALSLIHI